MNFGSSVVIYGLSGAVARGASLLVLPLITTHLTPSEMGVVGIMLLVGVVLGSLASLGTTTGVGTTYFRRSDPDGRSRVIAAATLLIAAASLTGLAITAAARDHLADSLFGSAVHAAPLLWSVVAALIAMAAQPMLLCLQFERRAPAYLVANLIPALVSVGLTWLTVCRLDLGVAGVAAAQVIGQGAGLIAALALRPRWLAWGCDRATVRQVLTDSLPFVPSLLALIGMQHGTKYILLEARGTDAVGLYNLGFSIGSAMSIVVSAFQQAWMPCFMASRAQPASGDRELAHWSLLYVLLGGLACVGFGLFARPLVLGLFAEAFHPAWPYVALTAFGQFLIGCFSLLLPGLYFADRVALVGRNQTLSAAATLGIAVLLIPPLGPAGAALANLVGAALLILLTRLILLRQGWYVVPIPWRAGAWPLTFLTVLFALGFVDGGGLPVRIAAFVLALAVVAVALKRSSFDRRRAAGSAAPADLPPAAKPER